MKLNNPVNGFSSSVVSLQRFDTQNKTAKNKTKNKTKQNKTKKQFHQCILCFSPSLIDSCSVEMSRPNRLHLLYRLFLMLFQWPFVFPNLTGFDVKQSSLKFSFALLLPADNYYLLLRIHAIQGARVSVTHSTASENRRGKWK